MDVKNFAASMKKCREQLGLTQKELSQLTSLSPSTISSYENGTKFPTLENAISIANVLNVSLDEMCGGKRQEFFTYQDVFLSMLLFIETFDADVVEYKDPNSFRKYNALVFSVNNTIDKMIGDIRDIRTVLESSEATRDLYQLWKEKKSEEYNKHGICDPETVTGINDPDAPKFE